MWTWKTALLLPAVRKAKVFIITRKSHLKRSKSPRVFMDFFFLTFLACRKFESLSELKVSIIRLCRKVNLEIIWVFYVRIIAVFTLKGKDNTLIAKSWRCLGFECNLQSAPPNYIISWTPLFTIEQIPQQKCQCLSNSSWVCSLGFIT